MHALLGALAALVFVVETSLVVVSDGDPHFPNPDPDLFFEKMVIDPATNRVYIGAVNRLFELNVTDLRVRTVVRTGPREDSRDCGDPPPATCSSTRNATNSYTKALAVDDRTSKLVECSSLYQGRCRLRNLHNISQMTNESAAAFIASEPLKSTVVFSAPGPEGRTVLYTANTWQSSKFHFELTSIAAVSLESESAFLPVSRSISSGTELRLEAKSRPSYPIDYVGGFESNGFAYFATRQKKFFNGSDYQHSKLARLCTADPDFFSYTESALSCAKDGVDFNLLQDFAVGKAGFSLAASIGIKSETDTVLYGVFTSEEHPKASALCIFPMRTVETIFRQNIERCFQGTGSRNMPYFKSNDACQGTRLTYEDVKCGNNVNTNIGGYYSIDAEPVLVYRPDVSEEDREECRLRGGSCTFTAVAVNTTHSDTVVFIGTSDGRLLKAVVQDEKSAWIYKKRELAEPGDSILADLEFGGDGKNVFVLTRTQLFKEKVAECEATADCHSCMALRDPYCGWCTTSSTCTKETDCDRQLPAFNGFLQPNVSRCPSIRSVEPSFIQVTRADSLLLNLENMDSVSELFCQFQYKSGEKQKQKVESTPTGLRCNTPEAPPTVPVDEVSLESRLSIIDQGGRVLASTDFIFYDCSALRNCSSCVSSDFPCDWCVEEDRCVDHKSTDKECRKQHIVNGIKRQGKSSRKGPDFCPRVMARFEELSVASGEETSIALEVKNLDSDIRDFRCRFHVGSAVHEKLARRDGDSLECEPTNLNSHGARLEQGRTRVPLDVMWTLAGNNQRHALDGSDDIHIEVYDCDGLAVTCGLCLSGLDHNKYKCGWCSGEGRCARKESCRNGWMKKDELCAQPTITSFTPSKGMIGGKTRVEIRGTNLGRSADDVRRAVSVANVNCEIVDAEYQPSEKIVCTAKAAGSSIGNIVVRLKDDFNYTALSLAKFAFVQPSFSEFRPKSGPISGGTNVSISGMNLDAGSKMSVLLGDVPCLVVEPRGSDAIVCRTTAVSEPGDKSLSVFIDDARVEGPLLYFSFADDPRIKSLAPLPPHTTVSGGILVDVFGTDFSLLQRPVLVVHHREQNFEGSPCEIKSSALMLCRTPPLTSLGLHLHSANTSKSVPLDFSIEFGGEKPLASDTRMSLDVYSDPVLEPFSETRFYRPGDYLTINGRQLNLGAADRDYSVRVGGEECNLTALAERILTCRPPEKQPQLQAGVEPEVVVFVGERSYSLGILSYSSRSSLSAGMIGTIVVVLSVLLLLFVLLLIFYKRKSNSHTRQMRYLKNQMDTIEMKVATECKEAFAELQTSMNAYAADLPYGTPIVPFLEYKDYASRVLFPSFSPSHPVFRDLEVDSQRANAVETGLREFHKLLMNKTFLLSFVRTMENNKYFLSKDRVYVGSLLMVVLHEKMGYCTEILKQLLKELIERTVEKKFQPKILFRRSESVAERMLAAWFTFLMYKYLQDPAGKRLYDLYWCIKQQMEKGPQDAITLEARYSLSEEKLLRATFDFRPLTIFLSCDSPGRAGDLPVRVLDCDTITQVKEKCLDVKYRTTPYSERPSASDLDLEWRTGVNGRILLQDLDSTSKVEQGMWKRLNTLAHYQVSDGAVVVLLARQSSLYNLSLLSERSERSTLSMKNSPTLSRPFGTSSSSHSRDAEAAGFKLYHLVKPAEHGPQDNQEKMVTEIYLTRLLMMKGTLQKFINDLLEVIFSTSSRTAPLPACIKYMFDFMDEQALEHSITDPEVVHAWKSNALPLRFWVNLIKNPHFLFDIQKPTKVEGCLSVVAQTLMDACSTQDHQLTKDSPSSKLLFAKDMYQYRDWVDSYYAEIQNLPQISDQDMATILNEESRAHKGNFHVFSALNELYKYLEQYKEQLKEELEASEAAVQQRLPHKFQEMVSVMEYQRSSVDYETNTLGLGYNSSSRLMPKPSS